MSVLATTRSRALAGAGLGVAVVGGAIAALLIATSGHTTHANASDVPAPAATSSTATTPSTPGTTHPSHPAAPVHPVTPPSAAIETLQRELGQLNYYEGPVTGVMNTRTEQAITYLQRWPTSSPTATTRWAADA